MDSLAPHQLKKIRVGPPLTKLSGSAHAFATSWSSDKLCSIALYETWMFDMGIRMQTESDPILVHSVTVGLSADIQSELQKLVFRKPTVCISQWLCSCLLCYNLKIKGRRSSIHTYSIIRMVQAMLYFAYFTCFQDILQQYSFLIHTLPEAYML